VQEFDLDDRAGALVQNEPAVLLSLLGDELGMPWSMVADLVGVSPTAVRKWRRGGSLTPETRARLARLAAFCQVLPEVEPRITDVVLWLQSPVISGSTTITPADLFAQGSDVALLNRAAKRVSAEQLLDAEAPDWRATTRPDGRHRVIEAPDGVLAIVPVE
jgi:transcriptional regulator with XRE-family HTH domain